MATDNDYKYFYDGKYADTYEEAYKLCRENDNDLEKITRKLKEHMVECELLDKEERYPFDWDECYIDGEARPYCEMRTHPVSDEPLAYENSEEAYSDWIDQSVAEVYDKSEDIRDGTREDFFDRLRELKKMCENLLEWEEDIEDLMC
jgi:hypothetical protein